MTVQELIYALSEVKDKTIEVYDGNTYCSISEVDWTCWDEYGYPCHPDDADMQRPGVVVLWPKTSC